MAESKTEEISSETKSHPILLIEKEDQQTKETEGKEIRRGKKRGVSTALQWALLIPGLSDLWGITNDSSETPGA